MQSKLYLFIHQNIFYIIKMYRDRSWLNKLLSFTFKFGKQKIFSKFRICVGKFQIEAGIIERYKEREGTILIILIRSIISSKLFIFK